MKLKLLVARRSKLHLLRIMYNIQVHQADFQQNIFNHEHHQKEWEITSLYQFYHVRQLREVLCRPDIRLALFFALF